jgi:hypothetical protein
MVVQLKAGELLPGRDSQWRLVRMHNFMKGLVEASVDTRFVYLNL